MTATFERATSTPAPPAGPRAPSRLTGHATGQRHWAPKDSGGVDPAAHLTPEQIDALGEELDALRRDILADRGAADAAYIRRLIRLQRGLEAGSRLVLLASSHRLAWTLGTAGLTVAKILENMEIGHNVMHGQWDWMRDPSIHSSTWEWDHAAPSGMWKHTHNDLHHTYTNVLGWDNDLGYGYMRVDPDQPWHPGLVWQPLRNVASSALFQYAIAFYDVGLPEYVAGLGRHTPQERERFRRSAAGVIAKIGRHALRDYVLHPALSGPSWRSTITANLTANLARNVWTHTVIICGHFPEGVETFAPECLQDESRGEWYLRQILGSANISGGPVLHVMTGNLSHQIEHHMYPDLPSNRYAEIAARVTEIFARYDRPYATGPLPRQYLSVWRKVIRYSLPNGAWEQLREQPGPTARRGLRWLTGAARAAITPRRWAAPANA